MWNICIHDWSNKQTKYQLLKNSKTDRVLGSNHIHQCWSHSYSSEATTRNTVQLLYITNSKFLPYWFWQGNMPFSGFWDTATAIRTRSWIPAFWTDRDVQRRLINTLPSSYFQRSQCKCANTHSQFQKIPKFYMVYIQYFPDAKQREYLFQKNSSPYQSLLASVLLSR